MKVVATFTSELEAQLALGQLKSLGIPGVVRGAKEYSTHVLGGFAGRYELLVEPIDWIKAKEISSSWTRGDLPAVVGSCAAIGSQAGDACVDQGMPIDEIHRYLRRAYLQAILAPLVLPVVFNLLSLRSLRVYARHAPRELMSRIHIGVLVVLNIMCLFGLWFFITNSVDFVDS